MKTWNSVVHAVMKQAFAVVAVFVSFFAIGETYRVAPDAPGGGNGQSWTDDGGGNAPMTIAEAVAAANEADDHVVLLKAGRYTPSETVAFTKTVTVRGGLLGVDDETLADDPYSVIDGADTLISVMTYASTLNVWNVEFTRGAEHGLCNNGENKHLRVYDCRFVANGTQIDSSFNNGKGRAIKCSGALNYMGGSCIISNCYVAGNAQVKGGSTCSGGGAVDITKIEWAKVIDSTFVTNGVAWNYPTGATSFYWTPYPGVIDARGTPVQIAGCKFAANRVASNTASSAYYGPLVLLGMDYDPGLKWKMSEYSWDNSVSNCLFVGNEAVADSAWEMDGFATTPIFIVDTCENLVTCRVDNCTFAYNNFDTTAGSAGIALRSGAAKIRNCIFWGNRNAQSGDKGCDVRTTGSSGFVDIDYSMFASTEASNIHASPGTTILVREHVESGDPLFVTPFSEIEPLIETDGSLRYFSTNLTTVAALLAADLHVRNQASRAIDTGDPDYDYSLEPSPNGGRINLGRYGGTAEACTSAVAQPEFVGEIGLVLPYGTTQPSVQFALGGEPSAVYSANALIECCTNGVDYFEYRTLTGLQNGSAVDHVMMTAFQTGGTLTVRVTLSVSGTEPRVKEASVSLEGKPCPPSFGKGGGEGVIHVRAGATGDGSGRDWFHAVPALSGLVGLPALASADEIWIAGTNIVTQTAESVNLADVIVRGGFVGIENSLAERREGSYAVISGEDREVVGLTAGCSGTVEFERLEFSHCGSQGSSLTCVAPNSDVTMRDCRLVENGLKKIGLPTNTGARGLAVAGNATSTLVLTNCYIAGNATEHVAAPQGDGALVLSTLKRASLSDCQFVANGAVWTNAVGLAADQSWGCGEAALTVLNAPATLVGCVFRANRVAASFAGYPYRSAIVYLSGQGNALTNCQFVGNESVFGGNQGNCGAPFSGVLLLGTEATTDIESCTFAYNSMSASAGAAALTLRGGSAKVRNSIFYGNKQYPGTTSGADIWLNGAQGKGGWGEGSDSTLDIDYTLFEAVDAAHLLADEGSTITTNALSRLYAADPKLVSPLAEFEALLSRPDDLGLVFSPTLEGLARVLALNVHLRGGGGYYSEITGMHSRIGGKASPAIDAGDPDSDYSREPTVEGLGTNGQRINLGAYGNTPWATMTRRNGLILLLR